MAKPSIDVHSISSSQMREWDRKASEVYGIPSLTLMENAGRRTAELVLKRFPQKKILIVCGKGNNAGDGFVAARVLDQEKVTAEVMLLASEKELKGDAAVNFQELRKLGVPVIPFGSMSSYDVIVDAIFGIGIKSGVAGIYRAAIESINASGKPVVALDIPSGLDADDGSVHGAAVKASVTATMGAAKHGLLKGEGPRYCGEIVVLDIGLPAPA